MLYFATTGYLVQTVKNIFNGIVSYVGTFTGLRGNTSDVSSVKMVNPYGHGSIPPRGIPALLLPVNGSHKASACLGYFLETVDNIPHPPVEGEAWIYSANYLLFCQLNGLRSYKYDDSAYNATLPNGEFVGAMMLNRINELEGLISELNANYTTLKSAFDAHTHLSSTPGNPTGVPQTPYPTVEVSTPSTLASDTTYINDENYLINDNGTLYA